MGRTALDSRIALGDVLVGIIYRRINASETHDRLETKKTVYIANLSHQLRCAFLTHAAHGPDDFIL